MVAAKYIQQIITIVMRVQPPLNLPRRQERLTTICLDASPVYAMRYPHHTEYLPPAERFNQRRTRR